jgi:hypothetical protein
MTRLLIGFAVVVGTAVSAAAHHSAAAIDRTKSLTLVGTVKEFRWTNPHSWIDLDILNDKGAQETWSVEMTSPTFLLRAGWKSTTVRAGDRVSIIVRPLRSGEPGGLFVSITLPDGTVLGERPPASNPPELKP